MKTFAEILDSAPAKHVVLAPAPVGKIPADAAAITRQGHMLTALSGGVESVKEACRMVREKEADILMQGDISLSSFFDLLEEEGVKRSDLSYVTLLEDKGLNKLVLLTDTYIHNFPSLDDKISILNRAIEVTQLLGLKNPKVAALSAIETVNTAISSTVDAAVLSKMSQRRQFKAVVEGPIDIDAILSKKAAEIKGVKSPIPGNMDILLFPDIETAFALSQAFTAIGALPAAGVLLGSFPIIINPRFLLSARKEVEVALQALRVDTS